VSWNGRRSGRKTLPGCGRIAALGAVALRSGRPIRPKGCQTVPARDAIQLGLPGGGGFGDPRTRDPQRVAEDVLDGMITAEVVDAEGQGGSGRDGTIAAWVKLGPTHPCVRLALPSHRIDQCPLHRHRLSCDDGEQDARGAIGPPATLLPRMNRRHVEPEGASKAVLREAEMLAQLRHIDTRRHRNRVAWQIDFSTCMGHCLCETGNQPTPQYATLRLRASR
jgi:hypothetical protein